jgi:hypothetical protein
MAKVKSGHARRRSLSDPLAAALLPPPNESPVQREIRLKAETEAKKVSEGIDEMIRRERNDRKKSKAEVNVLLLGQSESGKSTTLKREYRYFAFNFPPWIVGMVLGDILDFYRKGWMRRMCLSGTPECQVAS